MFAAAIWLIDIALLSGMVVTGLYLAKQRKLREANRETRKTNRWPSQKPDESDKIIGDLIAELFKSREPERRTAILGKLFQRPEFEDRWRIMDWLVARLNGSPPDHSLGKAYTGYVLRDQPGSDPMSVALTFLERYVDSEPLDGIPE